MEPTVAVSEGEPYSSTPAAKLGGLEDPPQMATRATALLRAEHNLYLTDLLVAENIYVLESFYEVPRTRVAEAIRALLALGSMIVVDRGLLLRAVEVYETARLDFAEAYLVACQRAPGSSG
jgi:predicted nucleic-acid-binding protein